MSNIIKSRYVYLNDTDKKIIDSNEKSEQFRLINLSKRHTECSVADGAATALEAENPIFTEGIVAPVINTVSQEEEEEALRQAGSHIIEEAREQAEQIIRDAEDKAKEVSNTLYEESRIKGYEDGIKKGEAEALKKKKEYEALLESQRKEYETQIKNLEPEFADIVCVLIEKMTGVLIADKKNIVLYLIHKAIIHSDNCKVFSIRTSKEDYELVSSKKEELKALINEDATLDVAIDKDLIKNQCQIETESGIIDCSLDVQLSSLIQDIKLLSS